MSLGTGFGKRISAPPDLIAAAFIPACSDNKTFETVGCDNLDREDSVEPYDLTQAPKELIAAKLTDFEAHIETYRASLNTEGVWLFLTTLGCWSVTYPKLQLLALLITAFLFGHRIYSKLSDKRSFSKIVKDLEATIFTELDPGDSQKARLYELEKIKSTKLTMFSHLKATPIFFVCYTFLSLSVWYIIERGI
jgi:hypothetical protein